MGNSGVEELWAFGEAVSEALIESGGVQVT
jgi:hypothetical protein